MNDSPDLDFVVDSLDDEREYPLAHLTGWETIVFEMQEDDDPIPDS